jgi:hypothetical protein
MEEKSRGRSLPLLLSGEDTREEAMTSIRSLVDRIEVRAGMKRGETDVTLVGALVGILALGTNKNATPVGGGTFLLVAGARLQKYLPLYSSPRVDHFHYATSNDSCALADWV